MRTLLRMRIDTEAGSAAVSNGSIEGILKELMDKVRPEAAYFFVDQGVRTSAMVFDLDESSRLPELLEPVFQALKAEVLLTPVMNLDDLQRGLSALPR